MSQSVLRSLRQSPRKHAPAPGLFARSVRRILHEELKCHPYKSVVVQELNPRKKVCEALLGLPDDTLVFFSYKAYFHLSGSENPRELHQHPPHALRVTVWCALFRLVVHGF